MTLAEIQAKYSGIHTPEEINQFHQNMTNSKKWKIMKNEWTWDGLNHVQLRGRALQYHPNLDMVELYKEHPYKTALRLVPKEEHLEDSGDEESEANSDLEEDDDDEADYDLQIKEAHRGEHLLLAGCLFLFWAVVLHRRAAVSRAAGGRGFAEAPQLVETFQIRNASTSWGAASKPLPRAERRRGVLISKSNT